jgi:hypothetical protein
MLREGEDLKTRGHDAEGGRVEDTGAWFGVKEGC